MDTDDESVQRELRAEFESRMWTKFLWFPRRSGRGYVNRRVDRRWRDFQAGARVGMRIERDRHTLEFYEIVEEDTKS